MNKTYVYYSKLPNVRGTDVLYPERRMTEIERCKNEKTRREKYWVWALLGRAFKDALNIDIANLQFAKTISGKWISSSYAISLSHAEGAVAVAISSYPVGVDVERVRELRSGIEAKVLTESELSELRTLTGDAGEEYLIRKWCEKEAIFKSGDGAALLPRRIETSAYNTHSERVKIGGDDYMLTVAFEESSSLTVKEIEL